MYHRNQQTVAPIDIRQFTNRCELMLWYLRVLDAKKLSKYLNELKELVLNNKLICIIDFFSCPYFRKLLNNCLSQFEDAKTIDLNNNLHKTYISLLELFLVAFNGTLDESEYAARFYVLKAEYFYQHEKDSPIKSYSFYLKAAQIYKQIGNAKDAAEYQIKATDYILQKHS